MKSFIKEKKAVQWGKTLVIEELFANESSLNSIRENLQKENPNITEDEINKNIQNIVMKDNFYNRVMDEISSSYVIEFNEEEIKDRCSFLKENNPNLNDEQAVAMSKVWVIKKLIYDDLAAQWEIVISDEQTKETLENYYKNTGNSIREYLVDREKFEDVKSTILEQLISDRILNAFNGEFKVQKNVKS